MPYSFFALLGRMKYISRWGLMRGSFRESLSEHTLDTAYIIHALALINNRRGGSLDGGKAVLYALYHDCPEIITGDMPTPVKYGSSEMRDAYAKAEDAAKERLLSGLPEDMRPRLRPVMEPDEEYRPYLKAADKLSALIKCIEEAKAGNAEFESARRATEKALKELALPEAEIFMEEFLPAYSLTLDEL